MDVRKTPRDNINYGFYNCGILQGVERTRREAKREVEKLTGEKWDRAKRYMEIHKVIVSIVKK